MLLSVKNLRKTQILISCIGMPTRILYPAQGIKIHIYYSKIWR